MKAKVVLADDHRIFAEGLASLLSPHVELAAVLNDGLSLLDAIRRFKPDVAIADIEMPHFTGMDALYQIKKERLKCKIIFLTMHSEPQTIRSAMKAGAAGYLLKESAGEELITAIREVMRGHLYMSPAITKDFLDTFNESTDKRDSHLTPRQRQVLRLVGEGRTVKEIAAMLKISTRTVETYKYEMMRRLGLRNTAELIRFAIRSP